MTRALGSLKLNLYGRTGELPIDRYNVVIQKPEAQQRAPKIDCCYCHTQGMTWCKVCFAPLCNNHIYPKLSKSPYVHVFMYDGDEVFCRQHQPPKPPDPRGWL